MTKLTETEYDYVFTYVVDGSYPDGYTKNERRSLRRKCNCHFMVQDGMLYYSSADVTKHSPDKTKRGWRMVVRTERERRRIIESCHSSNQGKIHNQAI